jgi:hypothetical protein
MHRSAPRSLLRWGLVFLAIFLAIHWQEVTSPTFHVEDRALISSPIPQASQSRPGWDLIDQYLSVVRGMDAAGLPLQPRADQRLFSLTFLLALIASLLLARPAVR